MVVENTKDEKLGFGVYCEWLWKGEGVEGEVVKVGDGLSVVVGGRMKANTVDLSLDFGRILIPSADKHIIRIDFIGQHIDKGIFLFDELF